MPDTQKLTSDKTFVDVILPLAVGNVFTYRVPEDLQPSIAIGQRVVVQFGKRKLYTAITYRLHGEAPTLYVAKYIDALIDDAPVVYPKQLQFWMWLAAYYMCAPGEVMKAALPSGLKLQSDTKVMLHPDFANDSSRAQRQLTFADNEFLIVEALDLQKVLSIEEIEQVLGSKSVSGVLKKMLEGEVLMVYEEMRHKYKPKIEQHYRLGTEYRGEIPLKHLFEQLSKRKGKQLDVVMAFLALSGPKFEQAFENSIARHKLLEKVQDGQAAIAALVKKQILLPEQKIIDRSPQQPGAIRMAQPLSEQQYVALNEVQGLFQKQQVVLLHGVTGSGKTEVYIHLMQSMLKQGKQVLYLLPEIALTTQIISRLVAVFGELVGVYHSRYNENERVETWNKLMKDATATNNLQIIIGARSSVFLPFKNLGLIIIDEEHDSAFKQYDPAPRYNARDSAIFLATLHGAKVVLGSATPAVETYYNASQSKFGLVKVASRYGGIAMPKVELVNLKEAQKRKQVKSHFSQHLLDEMKLVLDKKEQVILFQNRRGFSPLLECDACGWTPKCRNCDVSLTFHKGSAQLRCHYCGFSEGVPSRCKACGHSYIKTKGFGTEKIEEEIQLLFPMAKVLRMDMDTTRGKFAHQKMLNDFEFAGVDILVGTQMVTKGLDFDKVALVGILNADSMLNFPDFRAFERSFQLMAQVAGRAGRKQSNGKVIVQTLNPEHTIVKQVLTHDYAGMLQDQLLERKNFLYPPFCRLIAITFRHLDEAVVFEAAHFYAKLLRTQVGPLAVGPQPPLIPRLRQEFQQSLLLKIPPELSPQKVKEQLLQVRDQTQQEAAFKWVKIIFDVDPQ